MRKITVIIALFILLPLWAAETGRYHSRGNAFEITAGGGYSSLGYKVNNVADQLASKTSGSYSLQAHIGYNWFFCEYAGLAVGADIQHYGQKATLNGLLTWSGVTDTDGEKYDHLLNLNNWTEQQNYWAVEIPVSFVFSFPVVQDKLYITAQVGGKYGIPLSAKYAGSGALGKHGAVLHLNDARVLGQRQLFQLPGHLDFQLCAHRYRTERQQCSPGFPQ